jgi:hypothetical protein
MQGNRSIHDDLTQITGIGAARQRWLAEVFDVRTYDDLAAISVDDIEAQLKKENKPYCRSDIELWPQEATKLAAKKMEVIEQNSIKPLMSNTNSQVKKTKSENSASDFNNDKEKWQQIAYFNITYLERWENDRVVERKTTINYHEADENDEWDGFETELIGQWIHEQAGDKLREEAQELLSVDPETEAVSDKVPPVRITLTITDLHIYQPAGEEIALASRKNGRPYTGTIQGDQPFDVEVEFEISKQENSILEKLEIPLRVQFYAKNRSTKEKMHLGDAESCMMINDRNSYTNKLTGIVLPTSSYRLRIVVIAEPENIVPGYLELPMLRVK